MATERAAQKPMIAGGRGDSLSGDREPHLYFGWGRHLPMLYQSEAVECGLACLAMVAGYYGQHEDLAQLRRRRWRRS